MPIWNHTINNFETKINNNKTNTSNKPFPLERKMGFAPKAGTFSWSYLNTVPSSSSFPALVQWHPGKSQPPSLITNKDIQNLLCCHDTLEYKLFMFVQMHTFVHKCVQHMHTWPIFWIVRWKIILQMCWIKILLHVFEKISRLFHTYQAF